MATAATSLLGLALPVTGELSGTWGDTVNVSITALLDTAVAGTTTLSSDADVTLTTTTLAANQARQAIILWTAGGTVTRTITVPAQSKSYIVINKTSSSQSIKIVGAGPTTGVTIVAGTAAFVVWNGVDFVTASVTSTTGILPVANGGTGLSSGTSGGVLAYTATGTLASSAALAANALVIGGGAGAAPSTTTTGTGVVTALGVNTGTAGAFVVNGGALGTPSSGTVTNLTGTASININGTVGATTANTGAFTTLSATGTVTSTKDGLLLERAGASNASQYIAVGNTSGQFYFGANGSVANSFFTGGTAFDTNLGVTGGFAVGMNGGAQVARISSTGLAVTGTLSATGAMTSTYTSTYFLSSTSAGTGPSAANIYNTSGNLILGVEGSAGGALITGSTAYATILASYANKPIQFGVNDTVRATISSTALALGVGISLTGGTSGTGYSFSGSAPATSLTLDSSGNLGLGVTPSAWSLSGLQAFQVKNASLAGYQNNTYVSANCFYSGGWKYIATDFSNQYIQSTGQHQWFNAPSGTAGNAITFTQAMTLDASGNLLVGTTSQPIGTSRIAVVTTGGTQAAMFVNDTYNFASAITWNKDTANNNSFIEFATEGTYTARGSITYNRAGGLVAYNVTSDYRAKDIYGPVTGSGTLIDSIPVYMGKMKDATQERPMFIAHEVPAYAHTGEKDAVDKDGKPVYQQMDASALIPVMWAELQSLRARVAQLESKA